VSIQDIWEFDIDWTLTTGVRFDDYSDFGATTNYRGALVWTTTDKLTSKLLYSTAFRAPTFSELYAQNNPVGVGNPNLDPETIRTTELAFTYEMDSGLTTSMNIYHYNTEDMIDFVANNNGGNTAQNNKSLTGKGIELEAQWSINRHWQLMANYSYQHTKDDDTHEEVAFIPKQQFYFDARWYFMPDWELSGQLNWVADRAREVGDSRSGIDDYTLVNLTLRRKNLGLGGKGRWEIAATINNLFDEQAYEPSNGLPVLSIPGDYPLNERRIYAEIRYYLPNK
jgi:iron complex outermembrane receptor protein